MKKKLRFTFTGGSIRRVVVNGKKVTLSGTKGSVDLPPGPHIVQWFIQGVPGAKWLFEVTAPPEAQFKREDQIDSDGKDGGSGSIRIKP
jgi:hypothetical protein